MSDDTKLIMGAPQSANMVDGRSIVWLVRPAHEREKHSYIYFGVSSIGSDQHLVGNFTVDDAEAIGYSLLYAVKLQRDKEANGDEL